MNEGGDEASELLRALDDMQHALRDIVTNVRVTADSIAVASTEIVSGNVDLSNRTDSAASSLQQTSNSMESLTGTVQHSAESAHQAYALAQGAATAAHRGNSIVIEVASNMDEIDSTSKHINDIIGVIDGSGSRTSSTMISSASNQQSMGIGQVNQAVTDLDRMTQQNAALVQHSAAAAANLKDQAKSLTHAMAAFHM